MRGRELEQSWRFALGRRLCAGLCLRMRMQEASKGRSYESLLARNEDDVALVGQG
jgi:hypothetical protein